jgi:predicted DsbA family dithiol-disulfide isomerase
MHESNLSVEIVSPDAHTITVWSDIGCPWATLALHTLRAAIKHEGVDILIDHRAFPLELLNERSTPKPIIDAEVVAIAGLVEGLEWRTWQEPEWAYAVTTLPAMEAVQAAKAEAAGGLRASDELDAALRRALYTEHRCISILPTVLDIASDCVHVNVEVLAALLESGEARSALYEQSALARTDAVRCSPHVFAASGFAEANPGVVYRWTGGAERGFPRLESYDPSWAHDLAAAVARFSAQ